MLTPPDGAIAMPDFLRLGLWANLAIFVGAAVVVWIAGTKLSGYAKTISERTGAGQAFIGILLLGAVVSLPEMGTTVSAAALGNAPLAVNTLLGGIAAVMLIMAVTDAATGPEALSADITRPIVLFQGVLVVVFMVIAAAGMVVGDVAVGGVGLWTAGLFGIYLLFIMISRSFERREPWIPRDAAAHPDASGPEEEPPDRRPTRTIVLLTCVTSAAVIVAGFLLAITGETIGEITGLGSSFIGMVLGGIATSLPEVSTTVAAVRLRQYEMAFADAFGTNLFSTMLLFVGDLAYAGGPILNEADTRFAVFATLLGILLTCVYLAGFVDRSNRTVFRMGIDSLIVIGLYVGGMAILYAIR